MSDKAFYEELVIAGFGGQGIILAGKLLAQTTMESGYEITYMPSYGAEVRGGTSNCMLVLSDELIASPQISRPTSAIIMNKASYNKFVPQVRAGGFVIVNTSRVLPTNERDDIEEIAIPIDDIANELNSPRSANMVALGAYLQRLGRIKPEKAAACLSHVLAARYHNTIPSNTAAIMKGAEVVASLASH